MSSRITSPFGPLGERVGAPSPSSSAKREGARHVVVDGRHPGVLVGWRRAERGWLGDVAYAVDGRLIVEQVPAGRLRPIPD